jgi:hypothetical protein
MARTAGLLLLLLVFLIAGAAIGQSTSGIKQTGSVEGRVICDDGGVPGRGANVRLVPLAGLPANDSRSTGNEKTADTTADFSGYYVFPTVPAGTYIVDARKSGYSADLNLVMQVLSRFSLDDQKRLLGTFAQVTVVPGSALQADVVIHRAGAISGHITVDGGGTPGQVSVTATMVSSKLIGSAEESTGHKPVDYSGHATVDDRGAYRIAGLPSGTYRVGVQLSESFYEAQVGAGGHVDLRPTRSGVAHLNVFASEALTKDKARLVSIGDGDELADDDINIPTRLLHTISGTVTLNGNALEGALLTVQPQGGEPQDYESISTTDGSYRFDLLASGSYTVTAKYPNPATSSLTSIGATGAVAAQPTGKAAVRTRTVQLLDADVTDANIDMSQLRER